MTNRLATNATQHIVWRWEGEAFGNTPAQELIGISVNLRFPGQYFDEETNLHYNHFRYYDPTLGRYITSDPMGLKGGLNTYVYAGANPLIYIDPKGLVGIKKDKKTEWPPLKVIEMVVCIEICLGKYLVITGGAEQTGHNEGSKHYKGKAADIGFGSNPGINKLATKFFCCAAQCDFKYGETEGDHYHIQTVLGLNGGNGDIPKNPGECRACE